jgi:choline dehydrogenase-like flavoprotein
MKNIAIVGSGIATLLFLRFLPNLKNYKITVYESGNETQKINNDLNKEHRKITKKKERNFKNFFNNKDIHYFDKLGWQKNLDKIRLRAFGGSINLWGSESQLFDDLEFSFNRNGNGSWPININEIKKIYLKIIKFFNFKKKFLSRVNREKYFSEIYWSRKINIDQIKEKLINQIIKKKNIKFVFNATVLDIYIEKKKCTKLELKIKDNFVSHQDFDHLILCAGAIENTRLLMNSKSLKKNLNKNVHKNLGKFFSDHPHGYIGEIINPSNAFLKKFFKKNKKLNITQNLNLLGLERYGDNFKYLGLKNYPSKNELGISFQFHYQKKYFLHSDLRNFYIALNRNELFECFKELSKILINLLIFRYAFSKKIYKIWAVCEQDQIFSSKISLFNNRDKNGQKKINIYWRISNKLRMTLKKNINNLIKYFQSKNYGDILIYNHKERNNLCGLHGGAHHFGTTRMSSIVNKSFLTKNLEIRGMKNIFILSTSSFPTNGTANSTLTLGVLAARLSRYINSINT